MNFSEFIKLMGADPMNRDAETLHALESGPEFEQAAAEAEAFEVKLKAVLEFPVNSEELCADIIAVSRAPQRRFPGWMAIAAGLIMVVGVAGFVVNNINQPGTIEQYVAQHYAHDGERLLARAGAAVESGEVKKIMADWDLEVSPELLRRITFIKHCPTLDGRGAHMVVQTDKGKVNLIIMPKTPVIDRQLIEFDDMQAYLVALGNASAAVIGRQNQSIASLDTLVRNSIFKSI